jgi:hypothetical protein
MKKLIFGITTLFMFSFVTPILAQNLYFGIWGGPNFADLDITFEDESSENLNVKSKTTFSIGGLFGMAFNKYLSLQLEPMYVGKGGIVTQPSSPDITVKSNHIELPLILKLGIGEKIQPYIIGGLYMSFVLNASVETQVSGLLLTGDLTEIIETTEYGALFGAGISIPVWIGSAFFEGRYTLGLTNLNAGGNLNLKYNNMVIAGFQTDPNDEIKTKGFRIMLGYKLPLGWE